MSRSARGGDLRPSRDAVVYDFLGNVNAFAGKVRAGSLRLAMANLPPPKSR